MSSWLHVTALVVYIGSIIGLWAILLPSLSAADHLEDRAKLLARGLKLYNPVQCGALGVLVMSGAFQLTALKAAYRELFLKQLGGKLAFKLILAFLLIILSVYQSMGVGHRYVRRYESEQAAVTSQDVDTLTARLRASSIVILLMAGLTSWVGMWLRG